MNISWTSISAGAMTAAVSLGSTVQSLSASASAAAQVIPLATAQALPSVTAGGLQAIAHGATNVATSASAALPGAVNAGAASTAQFANHLALVEKPAKAIAAGIPRSSVLLRTAGFLSKALPIVTIGAGTLAGVRIVGDQGVDALVNTKEGRGAVLGTLGGVMLLVPHPATQIAAAGALGALAANQFGAFDRLNRVRVGVAPSQQPPVP